MFLIITILAFIATLIGTSHLFHGIREHGISDVNYGEVIFPLAVTVISTILHRKANF